MLALQKKKFDKSGLEHYAEQFVLWVPHSWFRVLQPQNKSEHLYHNLCSFEFLFISSD